ncbi:uncharacterized protein DUF4244 [Kribbella rubisoli]|uniref:Uncharacterized protein DUF4244 n=1 Tax=Kribbella rubisoli TaxID=3075929 RepID=A0A4Q7WUN2_9ACTN|nr:uncharacterized protein DUF4244 [Kribbella rubisoli]
MPTPVVALSNHLHPTHAFDAPNPHDPQATHSDSRTPEHVPNTREHRRARTLRRVRSRTLRGLRTRTERGAATAEYAVTIVAACGLGGILVALLKSPVMQNALKALINYALKIAGVEGVHL